MESAIAPHLHCPRTQARRAPPDYQPPYPARGVRFHPAVRQVVMGCFGAQAPAGATAAALVPALAWIATAFAQPDGPDHWDRAEHVDACGWRNVISIGYWRDPLAYERWLAAHGQGWIEQPAFGAGVGTYCEVLKPSVQRFETLLSSDRPEGIARAGDGLSGEIQEHGYWGGMRDRLPAAQVDALAGAGRPQVEVEACGSRWRVRPQHNLCLIRSGQDWTDTADGERSQYLADVEPVLRQGMDFLARDGQSVGCLSNRYLRVVDAQGRQVDKSFGMSWWTGVAALERWAESHPTHVAIFGAAMKYLASLGPAARLRLYHEVTVAAADEQHFEYANCHARTGLMAAACAHG